MKILGAGGFEHKVIITDALAGRMIGSDHRIAYVYLYFLVIIYYYAQSFLSGFNRWPAAALMNNRIGVTKTWCNLLKLESLFFYLTSCSIGERRVWCKFA